MPDHRIEGRVDHLRRPLVTLSLGRLEDPLTFLVDTGFNREVHLFEVEARQAGLSLDPSKVARATPVGGGTVIFLETTGVIEWFGETREVLIHVSPGPQPLGELPKLGTEFLRDCMLEINFVNDTLRISS